MLFVPLMLLAAHQPAQAAGVAAHLAAYHIVYLAVVPMMALALLLACLMREQPLSDAMIEIAEGNADAPEY